MSSVIPDAAAFERRLAGLPVAKHPAGETVLTAGSKTGRLLFLGVAPWGRQGWRNDRQRVGTRLGVWRTGRPPRSASYGRREDPGAI